MKHKKYTCTQTCFPFNIIYSSVRPDKAIRLYEPLRPAAATNSQSQPIRHIHTAFSSVSMNMWTSPAAGLRLLWEQPVEPGAGGVDGWSLSLLKERGGGWDNVVGEMDTDSFLQQSCSAWPPLCAGKTSRDEFDWRSKRLIDWCSVGCSVI